MRRKVLLFPSTDNVEKFKKHLNKQGKNIALISEIEQNSPLLFLEIEISHKNNKFVTSIYQKSTSFEMFISKSYKCSLIETLIYRGFSICSNLDNFHQKINTLKSVAITTLRTSSTYALKSFKVNYLSKIKLV